MVVGIIFIEFFFLVTSMMELKSNAGSDRVWVWNIYVDFVDECFKSELLVIRFLNVESKSKGGRLSGFGLFGRLRYSVVV